MKRKELLSLCKCKDCPLSDLKRTKVFGNGPEKTSIVLVGEAPGRQEDRKGAPFVGRSGELLDAILEEVGLDRERVFVTNTTACRPPEKGGGKDSTPTEAAVACCYERLQQEVKSRQPKVIITLGAPASRTILNTTEPITSLAGQITWSKDWGAWIIPTFHPASVLHGGYGNFDRIFDAIQRAKRLLFKEVPFPKKRYLFRQDKEWFYHDCSKDILSAIRRVA